jgi:CPA2 family monovalent cation:H+ antiporter-2/glutathione-regulated potassium-efflux system protein KefB
MLETLVALLGATVIAVPISRHLGFGSILGYLVAGIVIGPAGLRIVTNVEQIASVAELGVTMLLFLIGLELRPHRLWILRKAVFGLGLGQMIPTSLLLAWLVHLSGVAWTGAAVLGAGLALSSTAIVLPMLAERNLMASSAGRDAFAVLLFQDIAFIPLVALVPLLTGNDVPAHLAWIDVARGIGAVAIILFGGSKLVRPIFRVIGGARTPEVFTATALLLVVGTAALAHWAGLSMSLGAFMAGVLLSDSEYRHELQADIEPFEGLLLGFFFISVGMSTNIGLALQQPGAVAVALGVLVVVKVAVAFVLGLIKRGTVPSACRFALALPEGSEFSFVLFAVAVSAGALTQQQSDFATLVVAASMLATPILFAASETTLIPRFTARVEPAYDTIDAAPSPVIICGFGRVGQIVGRVLGMQGISFTALEKDPGQVEVVRRFGTKVYFGNPERVEVMRAAGAETAKVLVVALGDMDETLRVAEMAKRHFPQLAIHARARNRRHAQLLMDLDIAGVIRETFLSSLRLSEMVLEELNIPHETAHRAIAIFREHDERTLEETRAIAADEQQLIQSTQQAAQELFELFEADQRGRRTAVAELPVGGTGQ